MPVISMLEDDDVPRSCVALAVDDRSHLGGALLRSPKSALPERHSIISVTPTCDNGRMMGQSTA